MKSQAFGVQTALDVFMFWLPGWRLAHRCTVLSCRLHPDRITWVAGEGWVAA